MLSGLTGKVVRGKVRDNVMVNVVREVASVEKGMKEEIVTEEIVTEETVRREETGMVSAATETPGVMVAGSVALEMAVSDSTNRQRWLLR